MRPLTIFAYASLALAAAAPLAHAQNYTTSTVYQFCSLPNCADGYFPIIGLIQGADGNFYGETEKGGTAGEGTIFKLSPAGNLTTLRETEEQYDSSLIQGGDWNYYYPAESGDVLKMSPSGSVTVLESADGTSTLIEGSDGNFYGIGGGGIIKISQSGGVSVIYQFCNPVNCTDGPELNAPLLEGSDGSLYGTTQNNGTNGYGTIYKLTKSGTLTTLYSFTSDAYGASSLVEGPDGNF